MVGEGKGELNVEGAMRLAQLVRTDINSNTAPDSPMLTGPAPDPHTTIGGQTFTWSQGIILKHWYATGAALETNYQTYYGQGVVLGDGVVLVSAVVLAAGLVLAAAISLGTAAL